MTVHTLAKTYSIIAEEAARHWPVWDLNTSCQGPDGPVILTLTVNVIYHIKPGVEPRVITSRSAWSLGDLVSDNRGVRPAVVKTVHDMMESIEVNMAMIEKEYNAEH